MAPSPFRSRAGFTYIAALAFIVIMGIMLGAVGQSWQSIMKRDREEELIWRGTQYRDAIERWYKVKLRPAVPLRDLKDLLKDPTSVANVRHLRRLYKDPLTDKEWQVIKDPNKGIIGVASVSEAEPLKQANFPEEFKEFEGKKKYSEWQFVYKQQQPGAKPGTSSTVTGLPGLSTPGGSTPGGGTPGGGTPGGGTPGGGTPGGGTPGVSGTGRQGG